MQQSTLAEHDPCSRSSFGMGSKVGQLSGSFEGFTPGHPAQSHHSCSVRLEGTPWLPFDGAVPSLVRTLLRWGERTIVLDLAGVSRIDAAGIGELVRAYNAAIAGNGALRVANSNRRIRMILERVGLFDRLTACPSDTSDRGRTEDRNAYA